jgi:hypothetical protein
MNNFLTKFRTPTSKVSLVITIKMHHKKAYIFHAVVILLLLCILKKKSFK